MSKLKDALIFAAEKHDGQVRKISNQPYIFHCAEVSQIVSEMSDDEDVMCAALLHDTVEDTKTTLDEVAKLFGLRVMRLVAYETENKHDNMDKSKSWLMRKQESIAELHTCDDEDAKKIWLGDKLSNMRSIYRSWLALGDDMWESFHEKDPKKHEWYYKEIIKELSEFSQYTPYKELEMYISIVFGGEHE